MKKNLNKSYTSRKCSLPPGGFYLDIKIKRSNQNSAQFRQVSACLNLATLHDKTCIISKIFLEKIDSKILRKRPKKSKEGIK